jgi:hypothetical protein
MVEVILELNEVDCTSMMRVLYFKLSSSDFSRRAAKSAWVAIFSQWRIPINIKYYHYSRIGELKNAV